LPLLPRAWTGNIMGVGEVEEDQPYTVHQQDRMP
jgi:hypothetical protein